MDSAKSSITREVASVALVCAGLGLIALSPAVSPAPWVRLGVVLDWGLARLGY